MIGYLARSLSGHDMNKVYAIVGETESAVYLADGDGRTKEAPKKKNRKHIQIIKTECPIDSNEAINHSIRVYNRRTVDV